MGLCFVCASTVSIWVTHGESIRDHPWNVTCVGPAGSKEEQSQFQQDGTYRRGPSLRWCMDLVCGDHWWRIKSPFQLHLESSSLKSGALITHRFGLRLLDHGTQINMCGAFSHPDHCAWPQMIYQDPLITPAKVWSVRSTVRIQHENFLEGIGSIVPVFTLSSSLNEIKKFAENSKQEIDLW